MIWEALDLYKDPTTTDLFVAAAESQGQALYLLGGGAQLPSAASSPAAVAEGCS